MIFRHIVSDCDATVNDQVEMNTLSSILTLYSHWQRILLQNKKGKYLTVKPYKKL